MSQSHDTEKAVEGSRTDDIYSLITVYWPYREYIDFGVGQLWYIHRPQFVVYKVDQFVIRTPLSSLILLNTRVCLLS